MCKLIGLMIVGALLCFGQVASAGPYEDGEAAYIRGDGYSAMLKWRPLAEGGNAEASYRLGFLFSQGRGPSVPSDQREARRWWHLAVEQGHVKAPVELSRSYFFGVGFPPTRDAKEAVRWSRVAVLKGVPEQTYFLGLIYGGPNSISQDFVRAHMWFRVFEMVSRDGDGSLKKAAAGNLATMEAKMSVSQIDQARQMATLCLSSAYRDCGEPERESEYVRIAKLPTRSDAEPLRTAAPPTQPQTEPGKTISPPQPAANTSPAPIHTPTVSVPKAQAAPARVSPPRTASIASPEPTRPSATSVPMKQQPSGTFAVPVLINGAITLNFTVDSGASDVTIPMDVVLTLMRTGTLTTNDFIGKETYTLADGSRVESRTFRIRSLKVGDKVVENVLGSEAHVKGSLLLGQSFLGKFKSWSIDNTKHALVLE